MSKIDRRALRQMTRRSTPVHRLNPRTGVLALALLASAACIAPPLVTASIAQTPAGQPSEDAASYTMASDTTLRVNADRTAEIVATTRLKVLSVAAVEDVAQQDFQYTEGMESFAVVEAFTEKADGTRTPVDPATIITRDAASGLGAVFRRNAKLVTVIFPDVAVGDTLVWTTRDKVHRDTFAGHLEYKDLYARDVARASSTTLVIAPSSLPLMVDVRGEGVRHVTTVEGTETRHLITVPAAPAAPAEERMTSRWDRDPVVLVSTFADYEELARSYWDAVRGATEVTPEIARLAGEITQGIDDRRAQARAISTWIKTNIQYVAATLGNTRVDVHDTAAILKNRYGDAKDVAVLASALLAAKGIATEHVLINSDNAYTLPEPATMAYLNDVILYLPEFGVYDDPGSRFASFGVLENQECDKPVVRVSDSGAHRARTPAMKPEDNVSIHRIRLSLAADGVLSGETELSGTGVAASTMRSFAASAQVKGLEQTAEALLRLADAPGKGTFEVDSPAELGDSYSMRARFTLDERISVKPAADLAIPAGLAVLARPGESVLGPILPARKTPFTCAAATQVEEIELTFAEGLPLPQKIDDRRIETTNFVYTAGHRLEGRTLKIRREFISRVPGQVCGAEIAAELAQPLRDVADSIGTHVTFADVK
jgi:hypothetical protein